MVVGSQALRSYAVAWRDGTGAAQAGKLELRPDGLRLESGAPGGRLRVSALRYETISGLRTARGRERLAGRPTLLLERRGKDPLALASVGGLGTLAELADQLGRRLASEVA